MKFKNNNFTRDVSVQLEQSQNKQLVFSICSEEPYLREDENFGPYYQVLEVTPEAINDERLRNGISFLKDHDSKSQLGIVKRWWIANKKLYVSVKFSRSNFAKSLKEDIEEGIRPWCSVGYFVDKFEKTGTAEDGIPILTAKRYTIYEASSVSIPADFTCGFNRELDIKEQKGQEMNAQTDKVATDAELAGETAKVEEADRNREDEATIVEDVETKSEEATEVAEEKENKDQQREVCPDCGKDPCQCEEKACGGQQKPQEKSLEITKQALADALKQQLEAEATEIRSLGELTGEQDSAEEFITQKRSLDQFKQYLKNKNSEKSKNSIQDKKKMEKKYFSISKLITAINEGKVDTESYEYQTNAQNKRSFNIENNRAVILTKEDLDFNAKSRAFSGTVAGVGYPNGGDTLVQTLYRPDLYAGNLRPQLTLDKTGYFDISSPDGRPVEWPVCTGGIQAGIVDLDGKLPSADMQWKTVKLQGKKIGAITQIPYSLLSQSAPKADAKIEEDLIKALYQVRDTVALTGQGYNADPISGYYEPVGILNTTGVNTVTVTGSYTWKDMLEAENKIREANVMSDNLAFVMNGETYVELCSTAKNPSGGFVYGFICEDDKIKNFPVYVNNAIPSGTIILGDFNELVVCDFDGLQIIPDPYTGLDSQMIRIAGWMQMDSVVQRPEAFTIITKS